MALMVAVADGDREGLAQLYHRYSPALMAVAMKILRTRREAEDLLHDVFLEVWRQAHDYDQSRGSVRTWMLMRMRSRALDRVKSAGFSRIAPLEAAPEKDTHTADEDPALAPDRGRLRMMLARLPTEQRTVLELAYFEGLSSQEIALRVGVPMGTVKSRVRAGLDKLRLEMGAPISGTA